MGNFVLSVLFEVNSPKLLPFPASSQCGKFSLHQVLVILSFRDGVIETTCRPNNDTANFFPCTFRHFYLTALSRVVDVTLCDGVFVHFCQTDTVKCFRAAGLRGLLVLIPLL